MSDAFSEMTDDEFVDAWVNYLVAQSCLRMRARQDIMRAIYEPVKLAQGANPEFPLDLLKDKDGYESED